MVWYILCVDEESFDDVGMTYSNRLPELVHDTHSCISFASTCFLCGCGL